MEKTIHHLRIYFRITTAAFSFVDSIVLAVNGTVTPNKMKQLHFMALEEIEKENPNMLIIDRLLKEMETTAKK